MRRRSSLWFRGVEERDTGYRGPPEARPATVVEWRGQCPDRAGSPKRECGGSGGRACLEGGGYCLHSLGWPFDLSIRAVGSDVNPDQTYTRSPKRSSHPQIPPTRQNFDWVTIIGLVEDVHSQGIERGPMARQHFSRGGRLPQGPYLAKIR